MIDGGMTWTFFDWSGSEKLKAKAFFSTRWLDLTREGRYLFWRKAGADAAACFRTAATALRPPRPRTALLCNVRTFGTYLHTAGDGQIDYYFILRKRPGGNCKTV